MILKILELFKKNFPINEAVEPKAIKTKEKPKVKKIVLTTIKFFFFFNKFFQGCSRNVRNITRY